MSVPVSEIKAAPGQPAHMDPDTAFDDEAEVKYAAHQ